MPVLHPPLSATAFLRHLAELGAESADSAENAPEEAGGGDGSAGRSRDAAAWLVHQAKASGLRAREIEAPLPTVLGLLGGGRLLFARDRTGALYLIQERRGSFVLLVDGEGSRAWRTLPSAAARLGIEDLAEEGRFLVVANEAPFHLPAAKPGGGTDPWQRTRALLSLEREDLTVVLIYGLCIGLLSLAVPIAVQALVSTVAFGAIIQPVVVLAALLLFCLALGAFLRSLQTKVVEMLQRRLFVRVVLSFVDRCAKAPVARFEAQDGRELMNRYFDIMTAQKAVASLLVGGVDAVLIATVGMIVLAFYHPFLLVFDILLLVAVAGVFTGLGRGGTSTAVKESKSKYTMAAWLEELAARPTFLRSAGGLDTARARTERLAAEYLESRDAHFRVAYRQLVGALAVQVVASAGLLTLGGVLVVRGQLTLGQLVAAELIVTAVVASVAKLGGKAETFYDLLAAVDKIGEVLDLPAAEKGGDAPAPSVGGPSALEIDFPEELLDDESAPPSVLIKAGERVAILGREGSFARALFRGALEGGSPEARHLSLDGVKIADLAADALRSRIAVIDDPTPLPGTILESLRSCGRALDQRRAREILRRVGLDERVEALPGGLHTALGPEGQPLDSESRIALAMARAIAAEPGLILIDGALDRLAQEARHRLISRLLGLDDLTLIVLTDEPAIAERFDRCVVGSGPERGGRG